MVMFQPEYGVKGGEEWGERGPKCLSSSASHSLCVFNKVPTNWGANTWKGRGEIVTHYQDVAVALALEAAVVRCWLGLAQYGFPEGFRNVPLPTSYILFEMSPQFSP